KSEGITRMSAQEIQGEIFALFPQQQAAGPGPNRKSLEAYLEELDEHGLLNGKTLVLGNSLRSIADAVDRGMLAAKVSIATTTLTKTLIDGLAQLPEIRRNDSGDAYDALQGIIEQMTNAALGGDLDDDAPEF
ncbi:hypothetical protein, partial [Trueperella pyogenes]